jgi:hypothetical protein
MTAAVSVSDRNVLRKDPPYALTDSRNCRVELPLDLLDEQGSLLDWVIDFAFDTLDARHLDLRIVAETHVGG